MKIIIQENNAASRIDKYLSQKLALSRAFIQKRIKDGSIAVNGKSVNAHYLPRVGDEIEIAKTKQDAPSISPNKDIVFEIADETDEYVVINKPSGLAVHPAHGIKEGTLADALVSRYPEIADIGDDSLRPGIVHRLDKDASGLMVVARTQKMFDHIKRQFQARSVEKEYIVLAHGAIEDGRGIIDTPIGRSRTKSGKMAAHPAARGAQGGAMEAGRGAMADKKARTEFYVIERLKNYTLLKVKILTGRSHQIRVHLHSIGHPAVGDTLYANKKIKQTNLHRLFLHASKLGFNDLNGKRKEYKSNLPEQLKKFYETLN